MELTAYVLVAMACAFGLASSVGVVVVMRKINKAIAKAASDPDHVRRAAALPVGYRVLNVVSSITLVTSILAFANSEGVPWLWVGTLVGVGLFWALVHFDIGANVPDRWVWPILGIVIGANIFKSVWDFFRKRKANAT